MDAASRAGFGARRMKLRASDVGVGAASGRTPHSGRPGTCHPVYLSYFGISQLSM
jgi:hypothetical protein